MLKKSPRITVNEYQKLTQHCQQLQMRGDKPYILLTPDKLIIKHSYRRGFWSSSTIWPYPYRFQKNCESLKKLGFSVPAVEKIYFYPEKNCYLILYPLLTGQTIYATSQTGDLTAFARLPNFIAKLHQCGIYFRDLHIDNFIATPQQDFALIDVASVKIYPQPLTPSQRNHNLEKFFQHQRNHAALEKFGKANFLQQYQLALNK